MECEGSTSAGRLRAAIFNDKKVLQFAIFFAKLSDPVRGQKVK